VAHGEGNFWSAAHAVEAERADAVGREDFATYARKVDGALARLVADDDATLARRFTARVDELAQRLSRLADGAGVDPIGTRANPAADAAGADVDALVEGVFELGPLAAVDQRLNLGLELDPMWWWKLSTRLRSRLASARCVAVSKSFWLKAERAALAKAKARASCEACSGCVSAWSNHSRASRTFARSGNAHQVPAASVNM